MKIGLYLQDKDKGLSGGQYERDMQAVRNSDIDLLVFPETCITPFSSKIEDHDIDDYNLLELNGDNFIINECMTLAKELNCAVIFSGIEKWGAIFSVFVNPFAQGSETQKQFYIKHTATDSSAFDFYNYSDNWIAKQFYPIIFNGHKLGMTICYDCNHAAFSRMWRKNGIDILINCTGGNVDYYKWYRYNKIRAIENHCIDLCTMGYERRCKNTSYTYGFSPSGGSMKCTRITPEIKDTPCGIFVYDTENISSEGECDIRIDQVQKSNKYPNASINPDKIDRILKICKKIEDSIYVQEQPDRSIVYILLKSEEIEKPEIILKRMYSDKLKPFKNKRYIIINTWDKFDRRHFENTISDILRVRSMENYCIIFYVSPDIKCCYQTTQNRASQIVPSESDGYYALDLERAKGPEVIWKNSPKNWRNGYEKLINLL